MPATIVVGLQWGDEGKGKIIDALAAGASHVVRAQGGHNAGHTVLVGDQEFAFHLLPSGILYPYVNCYLGAGMVICPEQFEREVANFNVEGRLFVSPYAHIISEKHIERDLASGSKIGTTGRGIGPCYVDKVDRNGVRAADSDHPFLQKFIAPVEQMLHQALQSNETILLEGAQGTLLDITFGTYPYVTSSNTLSSGVCLGAGVPPNSIDRVIGVLKAFQTRVGNGPFPTEEMFLDPRTVREVGTTTQRVRRLGWFDAVLARYAIQLNGAWEIALTKIDVLDTLEEIKICYAYNYDGGEHTLPPPDLSKAIPCYKTLPGWMCDTSKITTYADLPQQARNYIDTIESLCSARVRWVSNGPRRDQLIERVC